MCNLSEIYFDNGYEAAEQNIILKMLKKGKTPEEIADMLEFPMERIIAVQDELNKKKFAVVAN